MVTFSDITVTITGTYRFTHIRTIVLTTHYRIVIITVTSTITITPTITITNTLTLSASTYSPSGISWNVVVFIHRIFS